MSDDKKYPVCPRCGTDDYDVDDGGTPKDNNGYCILSCGAVFQIKDGKATLTEYEVGPIMSIP
jgi:hypothetical protein